MAEAPAVYDGGSLVTGSEAFWMFEIGVRERTAGFTTKEAEHLMRGVKKLGKLGVEQFYLRQGHPIVLK